MGGGIGHTRDFFWHIGVIMFFTGKKILQKVQWILGRHSGGVFKRIDENRELLELLHEKAPALLASHPWVEGWLKSQDEFLSELATQVPLTELQFSPTPPGQPGHAFPRPWPEWSAPPVPESWVSHAYPLKQITVQLQGTKFSDQMSIITQLETVLARLRAGEQMGEDHDDDFGYRFSVDVANKGPSFFDEPAGSN